MWKHAIYHIVWWRWALVSFSSMVFVFNKGTLLFQQEVQYHKDKIIPQGYFFCITFVWKEGFHFSEAMCFCSVVSLVWKGICIHAVMSLLQMVIIYVHFYFRFLLKKILLHSFFLNQSIHNCVKVHRKPFTFRFQQML